MLEDLKYWLKDERLTNEEKQSMVYSYYPEINLDEFDIDELGKICIIIIIAQFLMGVIKEICD